MTIQTLALPTLKKRISSLTVNGSAATYGVILASCAELLTRDGNSEGLRFFAESLKAGMVGKPSGLTFKTLAGYITELGGVLGQGRNDALTLSGLNKKTNFDPEFYKRHATEIVKKTPTERFESLVSKLLNDKHAPLTKAELKKIIDKTMIKAEKKAA
jgi:hypothetical protein